MNLPILNITEARFDCTFGRGCDGICCRNGRPPIYPDEAQRIDEVLPQILPLLRPTARSVIESAGYLSRRRKAGQPMARVVDRWCIFFNQGCTLHQLGAREGDRFRYKPAICAIFPIDKDRAGNWYVRQKSYHGEIWDLPCLDPPPDAPPAAESLRDEIALASTL